MQVIPKLRNVTKLSDKKVSLASVEINFNDLEVKNIFDEYIFGKISHTQESPIPMNFSYDESLPSEGYSLKVTSNSIDVRAKDINGVIYAAQTMRILADVDLPNGKYEIEECEILDYPEFAWRGLLLDEARHFFGISSVKRLLDLMVLNKLNVLHWHLTDDQGWRIEIKKYPLLTQIGSKRSKSNINGWRRIDDDGTPHEGFYTQEEIKQIVAYAKDRGIMILPEIDMPGHFTAAFAAYPWLACREIPTEVAWYFGGKYPKSQGIKDWNRSACIGKKSTFDFIHDIIDEICELFPSPYFHIGGDEAPKEEWTKCPHCLALMREKGLEDVNELQSYFINQVGIYIKSKNKELIAWNEVLQGNKLDNDVVVQYWTPQNDSNVAKHVKKGGRVILSKHQAFYFDMCYCQYPLSNTYKFTPYFNGLTKEDKKNILGMEGTLWTEWVSAFDKAEMHLFPRVNALAEVSWGDGKKDFREFLSRLEEFKKELDALKVNYAETPIAMPKGMLHRGRIVRKWYFSDQNWEYNKNKSLK